MEDKDGSLSQSRSDSKLARAKWKMDEFCSNEELDVRKMRDLGSAFHADGKEPENEYQFDEDEMSQVTEVPPKSSLFGKNSIATTIRAAPRELDLNNEMCNTNNLSSGIGRSENFEKRSCVALKGFGLDLNMEDVCSLNQCDPSKKHVLLKSRDASECGSTTTGLLDEKDPLKVWKEMKLNGFLSSSHGGITMQKCSLSYSHGGIAIQKGNQSSSHGGITMQKCSLSSSHGGIAIQKGNQSSSHGGIPVPKQRGRKRKQDVINKKMELAKKEQVDRFTKIAAPSGLLNDLNPGIINHVRNRKQVHSIIEALVRSEKHGSGHSDSSKEGSLKDVGDTKEPGYRNDSVTHSDSLSHEDVPLNLSFTSDDKSRDHDSNMVDLAAEDDTLSLKLSSYLMQASENHPSSNAESTNFPTDSSLTMKAATVASQWLELIHQDVKGRLSALRRSKKRVRAVITTELPFLIAKEFSSNQENDPYTADGCSSNTMAEMHRARWGSLFDQMDTSLSEEETQLESWLNQVKEMQLLCNHGLQVINWNSASENNKSGTVECPDRELALRAAAASIYSTCSFLLSKENITCC